MTDRVDATGVGVEVILAGKTYKAGVWNQEDFATWEQWVRQQYRRNVLEDTDGLSAEEIADMRWRARDKAASIHFTSPESISLLSSPQGVVKLWWIALQRYHPELTEDRVAELLLDPSTDWDQLEEFSIIGGSKGKKVKGRRWVQTMFRSTGV